MKIAKRIKELRESAHLTQQELADKLSISRSTLAGYESENKQPSYQVLTQMAAIFKVPTDYILSAGVFENWELLLKNKMYVLEQISIQARQLSTNIKEGVDDISYVKLVYAFNVHIDIHEDGTMGLSAKDPIPTYTENYSSNTTTINSIEKEIISLYRESTSDTKNEIIDLLNAFCALNKKKRTMVLSKCYELEDSPASVAAEAPLKKTGTDNLKK